MQMACNTLKRQLHETKAIEEKAQNTNQGAQMAPKESSSQPV
jgi:hypothetical protein